MVRRNAAPSLGTRATPRFNRRPGRWLTAFFLGIGLLPVVLAAALPVAGQERAMVPVTIDGATVKLATITYKPAGNGPFPTLIFHHGSTGRGQEPATFARPYDPKALAGW